MTRLLQHRQALALHGASITGASRFDPLCRYSDRNRTLVRDVFTRDAVRGLRLFIGRRTARSATAARSSRHYFPTPASRRVDREGERGRSRGKDSLRTSQLPQPVSDAKDAISRSGVPDFEGPRSNCVQMRRRNVASVRLLTRQFASSGSQSPLQTAHSAAPADTTSSNRCVSMP